MTYQQNLNHKKVESAFKPDSSPLDKRKKTRKLTTSYTERNTRDREKEEREEKVKVYHI